MKGLRYIYYIDLILHCWFYTRIFYVTCMHATWTKKIILNREAWQMAEREEDWISERLTVLLNGISSNKTVWRLLGILDRINYACIFEVTCSCCNKIYSRTTEKLLFFPRHRQRANCQIYRTAGQNGSCFHKRYSLCVRQ